MVFVLIWMRLADVGVNGEDLARVDEASSQNETSSLTDGVVTFNYNDDDDVNELDDDELDENKIDRSTSNPKMVVVNVSQFVAKIKGGLKHAQKIANRLNIKLVKQVGIILI